MNTSSENVVVLSGGVGGARFLAGMARIACGDALTAIVNTGDDFVHLGLHVSPDLDSVMYTLAGLAHEEQGWGVADETFRALGMVRRYGGEDWFRLGDQDLGTHLCRTQALTAGETLSQVTQRLCRALGVRARVVPMSDDSCRTMIDTVEKGTLPFQEWLVRQRAAPTVRRVWFDGSPRPAPAVLPAIAEAAVVIIAPSNPFVSIDPILSLPGVREALSSRVVVAVSPIVHGKAIKGPLAKMFEELGGEQASAGAVQRHYAHLIRGIVVETGDEPSIRSDTTRVLGTRTIMRDMGDRERLAEEVLAFARGLET